MALAKLSPTQVDALKPQKKRYKVSDGGGLYVLVTPDGSKLWRWKYRFGGKEKLLALGKYPATSLKLARKNRGDAAELLAEGVDPSAKRQSEKAASKLAGAETFKAIAEEWLDAGCPPNKSAPPTPRTIEQLRYRLKEFVYPYHGTEPIKNITVPALHTTFKRIVHRGHRETAQRVRSAVSRVFRYAVATGRAERDPAGDLKSALPSGVTKSFPAITKAKEIGPLLRAIYGYQGQPAVMAAIKLLPLVFVRPGELRRAEWSEFDLEAAEWVIPASRTKMRRDHVVPLSTQAVAILEDLHQVTGRGRLVFPGLRSKNEPIGESTLNAVLRVLGYSKEQMVAHGFRSMASTQLNELGFDPDIVEAQLAHLPKDRIRALYNRSDYAEKRDKMMQSWSDYLDGLRTDTSSKVAVFRANKAVS